MTRGRPVTLDAPVSILPLRLGARLRAELDAWSDDAPSDMASKIRQLCFEGLARRQGPKRGRPRKARA
jgi:hypothetical protein